MEKTMKITKKDILSAIATLVSDDTAVQVGDVTVTGADITAYVGTTIDQLEAKAEKARERAAKAKADGDEVRDAIEAVLTNEFKTIADIIAEVGIEDLTPGKVSARVSQLIKLGRAVKTDVKSGDRKVKAYALPGAETDAPADDAE